MSPSAKGGYPIHFLAVAILLSLGFFMALGFWPPSPPGVRATEAYRKEIRKKQDAIAQVSSLLDLIHHVSDLEQEGLMATCLELIQGSLVPGSEADERALYAAVDRRTRSGLRPFTEVLRYERHTMDRWTEELSSMASESMPDHNVFCLRAERLMGLVESHLGAIEDILLPILDRSMTPAQFRREVETGRGLN